MKHDLVWSKRINDWYFVQLHEKQNKVVKLGSTNEVLIRYIDGMTGIYNFSHVILMVWQEFTFSPCYNDGITGICNFPMLYWWYDRTLHCFPCYIDVMTGIYDFSGANGDVKKVGEYEVIWNINTYIANDINWLQ